MLEAMIENVNLYCAAISLLVAAAVWKIYSKDNPNDNKFKIKPMAPMAKKETEEVGGDDIISKMKAKGRNILVLYGSQTGTAEDFSAGLAREAHRYEKMKAMVVDPEEIEYEDLGRLSEIPNSVLVFLVATYGEGDPTDNTQTIYDWLQDEEHDESLFEGQKFAVFGLGNKTYEFYNAMGIYFDKRLVELGGERIVDLGLGDDDANIEEDFNAWKEQFWLSVCRTFKVNRKETDGTIRQYKLNSEFNKNRVFTGEVVRFNSHKNQRPPYDSKNPYYAKVVVNKELHNGGDRSCMHIEVEISDAKIRYEAGDHIAVYASNNPVDVDKLCKFLGVDGEQTFSLENVDEDSSKKYPFPCPTTYRTALSHYVDIHGQPRSNLLAELVQYSPAQSESRLMLEKLCGIHGQDPAKAKKLYQEWVLDARRTIYHILEDLDEVKIPADHLLELLPRLQPRYYSIASSPKHDATRVAICAILVKYKASKERLNIGVATGFMSNKLPSEIADVPSPTLPIFIRRSQFKLPFRTTTPVIMVGPGTGFAPFRGFLQQRQWQRLSDKRDVGTTVLFTGCRNKAIDYIYADELDTFVKNGTIDKLFCAFSRDAEKKVYVQNLLQEQRELVWNVINKNGHIYVCGDAKNMARDVNDVIIDIISEFKKVPKSSAQDFLKSMRNKGRYQEDVWS